MSKLFSNRLSFKLAQKAILATVLIGFMISLGQIILDSVSEKSRARKDFELAVQSIHHSASTAAYQLDEHLAEQALLGLFAYSRVAKAELLDDQGKRLAYRDIEASPGQFEWLADLIFGELKSKTFPLLYGETRIPVGDLKVEININALAEGFFDRALTILIFGLFRNILLSLALVFLFHVTLTKPLNLIISRISKLDLSNTSEINQLEIPQAFENNELGTCLQTINQHFAKRYEADQLLKQSETRFQHLFDSAEVSIWNEDFSEVCHTLNQLRQEGVQDLRAHLSQNELLVQDLLSKIKVLHVNRATLKLFEAQSVQDLQQIGTIFAPGAIDLFMEELCAIWEKKPYFHEEASLQTLSGKELSVIVSMPIPETEEGYRSLPVSILDITDLRQAQKALMESEKALRRSQKMEAIGQLTGGVAHDFNNMLGVIIGNLEILKLRQGKASHELEVIENALYGAKRAAALTRKLLDFSKLKQESEPQILSINQAFLNLENLISKSLTVSINFQKNLASDSWPIQVVPGDFEDALLNLVINARDAMPNGGTLHIETENKVLDEDYVRFNPESEAGEYVMLSITDTGMGISKDFIDRVFEPFFSSKQEGKGTGLGLSMVYGFVRRSGGHIKIYSELGQGTSVRMYLPRAQEETSPKANLPIESTLPHGSETILIVEDEVQLAKIAENNLQGLGYTTHTASAGKQALELLKAHPTIDLLFSDVILPGGLDGYQLAQAACKIIPSLKVLITSGFTRKHEESVNGEKEYVAKLTRHLLSKPYNLQELAHAVRQALDRQN